MTRLIFVYNADAGFFNMVTDIAHKIFSPATYPCSLCDLTYGILKIRPEWDRFIKNAPAHFEFLHKDEFHAAYPAWKAWPLPAVFQAKEMPDLIELISSDQLEGLETVDDLSALVLKVLNPKLLPPGLPEVQ